MILENKVIGWGTHPRYTNGIPRKIFFITAEDLIYDDGTEKCGEFNKVDTNTWCELGWEFAETEEELLPMTAKKLLFKLGKEFETGNYKICQALGITNCSNCKTKSGYYTTPAECDGVFEERINELK